MADTNRASVVTNDLGEFDRLTLIRLGVWGLSAFLSMMLVVIAAQTDVGVKRAAAAVSAITSPPRDQSVTLSQLLARTAESEREARRLIENVRLLSMERERMATRIDSVEREVGGLTGSINKSVASAIQAQSAALDAKVSVAPPKAPPAPPPTVGPTASIPAATPAAPPPIAAPAARPPPPVASLSGAQHPSAATAAMIPPVAPAAIDPRTARPVWPSLMPPPTAPSIEMSSASPSEHVADAAETIPLPRPSPVAQLQAYAAAAARGETAPLPPGQIPQPGQIQHAAAQSADVTGSVQTGQPAQAAAAGAAPQAGPAETADTGDQPKVEIGVDLGPALSIARLRTRWEAFKQAQGASLPNVRPVVSFREISPNKPVELRLVVGPFAGIDVAVQFCQSLSGSQFPCQPAVYDGQRLVTR
jgi:hypothetical protein